MVSTVDRRRLIRELLTERPVASQGELLGLLAERGLPAAQSVLSRDLRALGAVKRDGVYQVDEDRRVTPLAALGSLLRGVRPASHFLLVRCEPGAASAVARALEAEELEGLVGTIAGDDTVLVALESKAGGAAVERLVAGLM